MARRMIVNRGRAADMLQAAIRREASRASSLLERDVEDLYAIIGSQLAAIQVAAKLAELGYLLESISASSYSSACQQ